MWRRKGLKVEKSVDKSGFHYFQIFNPNYYNRNLLCKLGGLKRISAPTAWYQNPYDASTFLHARPNLKKKIKKPSNFKTKFDVSLGSFPPKCRLGLAKIFFEKSPLVLELFRKKPEGSKLPLVLQGLTLPVRRGVGITF